MMCCRKPSLLMRYTLPEKYRALLWTSLLFTVIYQSDTIQQTCITKSEITHNKYIQKALCVYLTNIFSKVRIP